MLLLVVCFLFFESRMLLLNSVVTPLYLYFAVFVVPRRVANAKLLFIFGTAWKQITILGIKKSLKIQKMLRFFVLFPYDVTQLSLFLRFFI